MQPRLLKRRFPTGLGEKGLVQVDPVDDDCYGMVAQCIVPILRPPDKYRTLCGLVSARAIKQNYKAIRLEKKNTKINRLFSCSHAFFSRTAFFVDTSGEFCFSYERRISGLMPPQAS